MSETIIYRTDWLASKPVFYHELTNKVSNNINDIIDFESFDWDPDGLKNYLDFGYSVFGHTPIRYVKFLPPCAELKIENGIIKINLERDPAEHWIGRSTNEFDVLDLIGNTINQWEDSVVGEIVLPLSGGYDSRLLAHFIKDKNRIRSFTYGLSDIQNKSFEVIYAKKVAELLNFKNEIIPLGRFHTHFDEWYYKYGVSTHAHGMYHIEFYQQILKKINGENPLLTGLIGDAWSGAFELPEILNSTDVIRLGHTHNLHADSNFSVFKKSESQSKEAFFENRKDLLKDPHYRIIESMRLKMMLLSYMITIPDTFNFKPFAPFIEENIALGMLFLPPERRKDRLWQKEFFLKNGLGIDFKSDSVDYGNTLNAQALKTIPLKALITNLLKEIIQESYLNNVNDKLANWLVSKQIAQVNDKLLEIPILRGAMWRIGFRNRLPAAINEVMKVYYVFLTLYPLQKIIEQRNAYFSK